MIAIFTIIAVVVSMPIVAMVLVSIASNREDSALSLGGPPRSALQAAARRVVDFRTEATTDWFEIAGADRAPMGAELPTPVMSGPRRLADANSNRPLLPTKMSVRPAA
ncbi:MAG TPA: hypothetical protein VMR14_22295 [Streptosporangiaceae bacterium]|jgi:hypothetical protein|nr:hypothetical protein [Streptosporangiaceae bacterium]